FSISMCNKNKGCVVRVCNELSQNMNSLNKMFKYHLLEAN
ncbi:hypothetical protein KR215_003203, partial [Drosophila sulfurigaster]